MEIPIEQVEIGNTIVVKPGEQIAVDGIVINGNSFVDESMLSGEPVPVLKNENDKVFAGTINQKGSFQFKADKVGSETMLAHIIKMVQDAQGKIVGEMGQVARDADGKIIGEYRSMGLRPYTLEKARQFGFDQAYLEACL